PDELPAAIHRPERGVIRRGLRLQSLKLKGLALPGDGSLMVAHWPGPEEGRSCRIVASIVRRSTGVDNRREQAGRGNGRAWAGLSRHFDASVVASAGSSDPPVAAESGGGSPGTRAARGPP